MVDVSVDFVPGDEMSAITDDDKTRTVTDEAPDGRFAFYNVCCGCRMVHLILLRKVDDGVEVTWETPSDEIAAHVAARADGTAGPPELYQLREEVKRLEEEIEWDKGLMK